MRALKLAAAILPFPKPTLLTGPDSSLQLCDTIEQFGFKRVLIVTDSVLTKIGLINPIQQQLSGNHIESFIYDGVIPDPGFDQVYQGLEELTHYRCDCILAIGGGSSIDCAKLISALANNSQDLDKLGGFFKIRAECIPLFAIPTTAGTGSEVSIGAVVSNPHTHKKMMVVDLKLTPIAAAIDGKIMIGVPPSITAATGMDALTHAIEAYISRNATKETDRYALAATRLIFKNLKAAYDDGHNIEARQNMALASCYAGLAFTKASLGYTHAIAHRFGERYQIPHGLANAIALPHILEFSKDATEKRLSELALYCNIGASGSDETKATIFIAKIRELISSLEISAKLPELEAKDIPNIAKEALEEAHFNFPVPKYMDTRQCEYVISSMLDRC
ncbi:MAG: iron-containing alcohol dehydrogenase [Pseudomonadales bacterium]|nr:iron-containing alcohol dehydrogenase [Pseudomonadales bacterium]